MTFDPHTYVIEADLSRNDIIALHELCAGKTLVEQGCGGSTLFFRKICKRVHSYEPNPNWVKLTTDRLRGEELVCSTTITSLVEPPAQLPKADVYFIDGPLADNLRVRWFAAVFQQRPTSLIIVHDTRRDDPLCAFTQLIQWPHTAWIERVDYHYRDSNLLVVHLRNKPAKWENWNLTETKNRASHLHRR